MLSREELFSTFTPEDLQRIETAARAANKRPEDWLKDLVLKATNFVGLQASVAEKAVTDRGDEVRSHPENQRTNLRVEHIEREEGIVRLHVRLLQGNVKLSQGCTFGDARLRMNTEDTRLLTNSVDPERFIFVLANPHDVSRFEKGKPYVFKEKG
jgi:hypothetical protein